MRMLTAFSFLSVALFALSFSQAGEAKKKDAGKGVEATLTGKICCAKCELDVETVCMTTIVVKKDKKDEVYYFDAAGHKKFHDDICGVAKEGTVTGVVKDDGKKKVIQVKEVKFK